MKSSSSPRAQSPSDPTAVQAALDEQVRGADPDRWLSSRLVSDEAARADIIVLYALEAELAAIPERVTQPLLAEMRLTWWAEQMDGVFSGDPRKGHPLLEALSNVVDRRTLPRTYVDALIQAHINLSRGEGVNVEALHTGPMRAAAWVLSGHDHPEVGGAAWVWAAAVAGRPDEARALRRAANRQIKGLPAAAFPAVAHAALFRRAEPEPIKRLRLIWATARGRV